MPVKVTCIVKVDPLQYDRVFSMITALGLKAVEAPSVDPTHKNNSTRDAIGCYKVYPDRDIASVLVLPSTLQEISGVKPSGVIPHYESIEPKPISWKKRLIPIGLSSVVTFITVASAVEHYRALLDPTHEIPVDPVTLALILGSPTAITFIIQVMFKLFSREDPHLS